MAITNTGSVNEIMNRAAAEVGLDVVVDPFSRTDPHWQQLRYLLQTACEELALSYPWEFLVRQHQITTLDTDTGAYDLPPDFISMLDQTGWERSSNVPLFGPLSAQDWTYLLGRDLVSHTIYASFRIADGKFNIFPTPPPNGLDINFEYQSKYWNTDGAIPPTYSDTLAAGSNKPLFDKTLLSRYLKTKYLESKGFDSSKAQDDLNMMFHMLTGKDKGAGILSAGRTSRGFPYLDARFSTPDTGYGVS